MKDLRRIIWLASYPKSGNTWTRSFLAHYLMPDGQAPDLNNLREFTTGDIRGDFFNMAAGGHYNGESLEDWMEIRPKVLRLIAASKPDYHFVKTHCQSIRLMGKDIIPPEVTAAAIYIMRNPFDVAPSFARHQDCDIDTAIDRMANHETLMMSAQGIYEYLGRWDEHIHAWTNAPGLPRHVLRYEDLIANPAKIFSKLIEKFFRLPVDRVKLAKAVKANRFENMKKFEEQHGFFEKPAVMKNFFSKGTSGAWREDLTARQVGRIRKEFLPALEKWYPEMLGETAEFAKGS